ncbi:MAG: aminotransferase class V-fold PLP-dependent enzyme [Acidobacteriia bacterium]|nr:aminotransferase class V-fold PLP-dependent enzyme [Terriglobia bacterium]
MSDKNRKKEKSAPRAGVDRREFLATATGLASAAWVTSSGVAGARSVAWSPAAAAAPLALDGGPPVRATMLEAKLSGPQYYDDEERHEVLDVINNRSPFRWWGIDAQGKPPDKCINFEREYAEHQHTKYCIGVTSGTAALMTAMAALEVGPGDEVILPAWTWYACYDAIISAGALPVFAEVDESMDIDPTDIERHITPQTKAIMAVHILGMPADMDPVLEIARQHKLKVLEDCAQSAGTSYKGRPVGSMGECGIFSFQINKTISAGDGGAFVTSDPYRFERATRFHDCGFLRDGHAKVLGMPSRIHNFSSCHYRMNEFTGGVMRAQLRKLDRIVADFRDKSRRVTEGIKDLPGIQFRKQNDPAGALGNWVYINTKDQAQRDRFLQAMNAENVAASPMEGSAILPVATHIEKKETLQPGWPTFTVGRGKRIQYGASACPKTIDIWNRYVGIPMDPKFTDQDVADIITAVRKVYPVVMKA